MERKTQARRTIQGVVISDKNDKTIVVEVATHRRHPIYGKRVKYSKKYYAHDENNEAKNGDAGTIMETRRLSATKRFRLVSIDKKAELSIKEAEAELKEEILEVKLPEAEESQVVEVKAEEAEKPAAKKEKIADKKEEE
jgi:small subunit ribosomal protein S17